MFGPFDCGPRGRRGGWEFTFSNKGGFGGGFGGPPWGRGGPGRGRVFGHGDLKLVILSLLAEKPRHGYEIIRELEDRVGGDYSPSPGTVYPTLALLEDLGYAVSRTEEGNRKVYEITDEGRRHLEENRSTVDDIFGRVDEAASFGFGLGHAMSELGRSFAELTRATFRKGVRRQGNEEWVRRAQEILERARREIEGLN